LREYLWPHCGWSNAETVEMTMWEQNKAQISKYLSVLLIKIAFLSSLLRNSFYIECLFYKTSGRFSSPFAPTTGVLRIGVYETGAIMAGELITKPSRKLQNAAAGLYPCNIIG